MAHFAKLDSDNVVLSVVTLEDKYCPGDNEEAGRAYLESVHGWPTWKRTSYNTYQKNKMCKNTLNTANN